MNQHEAFKQLQLDVIFSKMIGENNYVDVADVGIDEKTGLPRFRSLWPKFAVKHLPLRQRIQYELAKLFFTGLDEPNQFEARLSYLLTEYLHFTSCDCETCIKKCEIVREFMRHFEKSKSIHSDHDRELIAFFTYCLLNQRQEKEDRPWYLHWYYSAKGLLTRRNRGDVKGGDTG